MGVTFSVGVGGRGVLGQVIKVLTLPPLRGPGIVLVPFLPLPCPVFCQMQGPAKPALPVRHPLPHVPLPVSLSPPPPSPLLSLQYLQKSPAQKKRVRRRLKWENRTPQFLAQPFTSCLLGYPSLPTSAFSTPFFFLSPWFPLPPSPCSLCTECMLCRAPAMCLAQGS